MRTGLVNPTVLRYYNTLFDSFYALRLEDRILGVQGLKRK